LNPDRKLNGNKQEKKSMGEVNKRRVKKTNAIWTNFWKGRGIIKEGETNENKK